MSQPQIFDTTFTKIYVGGLSWKTKKEGLISFFERFGEIIHANVVCDRGTDRSQGYGFVTFKDAESATRACMDQNPTIDGRITKCNLASIGANVKPNQSKTNLIILRHDDLCFGAPSFWQNLQQPSNFFHPLTTNQFYPQHPQQCYNYQQFYIYPLHYPHYDLVSYQQYYPMVYTNQWYYWPYQFTNATNGESISLSTTATSTELSSTLGSSSTSTIDTTSYSGSDGNMQS